jgi:hypothetical protein
MLGLAALFSRIPFLYPLGKEREKEWPLKPNKLIVFPPVTLIHWALCLAGRPFGPISLLLIDSQTQSPMNELVEIFLSD